VLVSFFLIFYCFYYSLFTFLLLIVVILCCSYCHPNQLPISSIVSVFDDCVLVVCRVEYCFKTTCLVRNNLCPGFDSFSKTIINAIDHRNGNVVSLSHWLICVILIVTVTFGAYSCYIRCNLCRFVVVLLMLHCGTG
jgi:hypothetical protein